MPNDPWDRPDILGHRPPPHTFSSELKITQIISPVSLESSGQVWINPWLGKQPNCQLETCLLLLTAQFWLSPMCPTVPTHLKLSSFHYLGYTFLLFFDHSDIQFYKICAYKVMVTIAHSSTLQLACIFKPNWITKEG